MLIPYKDQNPTKSFALVTFLFICINCFLFFSGYHDYGLVPSYFLNPGKAPNPELMMYTPITHMFMHGNLGHLLFNMLFLWIFGNNVEDKMGKVSFILFYVITGVLSGMAFVFLNPESEVMLVGASGAISAVLGAYLLLFPKAKIHALVFIIPIKLPAFVYIIIWFGMQILGLMSGESQIAWICHITGFIFGIVICKLFAKEEKNESPSRADSFRRE